MALAHADGGCDNCSSHAKEMISDHLGEITTQLNMRFCCPECRDLYVAEMISSPRIDHEHKAELLERFPHVKSAAETMSNERIEGLLGKKHAHKPVPPGTPTALTKTANPPVSASLLTSLRR